MLQYLCFCNSMENTLPQSSEFLPVWISHGDSMEWWFHKFSMENLYGRKLVENWRISFMRFPRGFFYGGMMWRNGRADGCLQWTLSSGRDCFSARRSSRCNQLHTQYNANINSPSTRRSWLNELARGTSSLGQLHECLQYYDPVDMTS